MFLEVCWHLSSIFLDLITKLSPRTCCGVCVEMGLMVQMDRQTPQQVRGDGLEVGVTVWSLG